MIRIPFNNNLFNLHVLEITQKINTKLMIMGPHVSKTIYDCLNYLQIDGVIKHILSADTNEMKNIIQYFEYKFPTSFEDGTALNEFLRSSIFVKEYDNWSSRKKYGGYKFVKQLNLKTCPYCNRNYTFVVEGKNGKLRPEIDHFYPKSKYPFLAMSFYNLIPSCSSCNHTKSDKDSFDLELVNPYDIEENNVKFSYTPKTIDFLQIKDEKYDFDNFEINIDGIYSNIKLFKLEELYVQHKDIVLDLLVKKVTYPESYIQDLSKEFGFESDEIYRFIFCNYSTPEEFNKRPLSKLTRDIVEDLKIQLVSKGKLADE